MVDTEGCTDTKLVRCLADLGQSHDDTAVKLREHPVTWIAEIDGCRAGWIVVLVSRKDARNTEMVDPASWDQ